MFSLYQAYPTALSSHRSPFDSDYASFDEQRSAIEQRDLVQRQQQRRSKEIVEAGRLQEERRLRQEAAEQERRVLLNRHLQLCIKTEIRRLAQEDQQRRIEQQAEAIRQRQLRRQDHDLHALHDAMLVQLFGDHDREVAEGKVVIDQDAGARLDLDDVKDTKKQKEEIAVAEDDPVLCYIVRSSPSPSALPVDSPTASIPTPRDDDAAATPSSAEAEQHFQSHRFRRQQLTHLSTLSADFSSHQSIFVQPSSLIFSTPSTSSHATDNEAHKLAFSSANGPFLAYEDHLVGLLSRVDAVESEGDRVVQEARKELVKRVEGELERLDQIREESWKEQNLVTEGLFRFSPSSSQSLSF